MVENILFYFFDGVLLIINLNVVFLMVLGRKPPNGTLIEVRQAVNTAKISVVFFIFTLLLLVSILLVFNHGHIITGYVPIDIFYVSFITIQILLIIRSLQELYFAKKAEAQYKM